MERLAYGRRASLLSIGCNVLLFAVKLTAGLLSGSVAIVADGVNNLSDAASNIISLLGFKLAGRPADAEHPYGHGRYEYLSGLMVAVLVLVAGVELMRSGEEKILHPAPLTFGWPMVLVLAGSVAVKLWMMAFNRRVGRKIGSETLMATAADSRNDAIATGAVLAAMLICWRWDVALDGWMGAAVAVFVLYSGFVLVRQTLDPLLGRKPEPELIDHIHRKIMSCPGVLGTHDLLIHDYGPGRRFASAHVEMAAEDDPMACRDALDALARDFLENDSLHILFQYDPISHKDTAENRLLALLAERMPIIDPRLTVHDLRLFREGDDRRVRFDCVVPADVNIPEQEIRRMLENIVRERCCDYACDITIDRDYMAV